MTKPGTEPGTNRPPPRKRTVAVDARSLSEVARHVVAPVGIKSTAWPKVRDTCHRLGWGFDGWQDGAGQLILAKNAAGEYAADTIVISIPRQVGKTYLIGCIIFALCLLEPGLRVIWTAHVKDTALETFRQFDAMAARPKVKPHIRQVLRGKSSELIRFNNGSTIEFGARESGFGRGRTDVDVLVFDEGQMLPTDTLENMGATQNVATNPLTFVMGTPPRPRDEGEFFTLLRQEALDGDSDGSLYIELSADRGGDPMDRDQWRKANPSFPKRTTERAMLRLRKKLRVDESWNREALGVWDEFATHVAVVKPSLWESRMDVGPEVDVQPSAFAVDSSHARELSIAACWIEADGMHHVEEVWAGDDEVQADEYLANNATRRTPIVIDSMSPANSLISRLKARRLDVKVTSATDMVKACGLWFGDVQAGRLTHSDQDSVNDALAAAKQRKIGTAGGWGWDRKEQTNIAPLVAHTLARYGATYIKPPRAGSGGITVF